MKNLIDKIPSLLKKEQGATMVEYAIMVALIAVVSIAIVTTLGQTVRTTFTNVNTSMTAINTG